MLLELKKEDSVDKRFKGKGESQTTSFLDSTEGVHTSGNKRG